MPQVAIATGPQRLDCDEGAQKCGTRWEHWALDPQNIWRCNGEPGRGKGDEVSHRFLRGCLFASSGIIMHVHVPIDCWRLSPAWSPRITMFQSGAADWRGRSVNLPLLVTACVPPPHATERLRAHGSSIYPICRISRTGSANRTD